MTKVLLLRVGIDSGCGGALAPIFADGTFEYVPIPEGQHRCSPRSVYFRDLPARRGGTLAQYVPERYRGSATHYDPEFETFTYGDPTRNKRAQLLRLLPGDVLAFYAGLRSLGRRDGGRLYIIGYFTVASVYRFNSATTWPPAEAERLMNNAHFRRNHPENGLVVVHGDAGDSCLLQRAIAISDEAQHATAETQAKLGIRGSLQRAIGRWVLPECTPTALDWIVHGGNAHSTPIETDAPNLAAPPRRVAAASRRGEGVRMDLGSGSLAGLARLRDYRSRRLSSWDRTGGNLDCLPIPAGECVSLGTISGPGCVRHIWMTMMSMPAEVHELRQTVFRAFWDGAAHPSIEVPLGDFFGVGFGLRRNFVSLPLQMSPQDGKGFNCWFPMPFVEGARFEIENQGASTRMLFFYIDYEEHGQADPELARFCAWWNRVPQTAGTGRAMGYRRADYQLNDRRPVGIGMGIGGPWLQPNLTGADNYVILDVQGRGHYVGCNLNVDVFERQVNDWYGEGDDMIFVDGEPWPPRLHGTGTEDYFGTAFCPKQEYSAPYHGITVYSGTEAWPWGGKNSMYRFHIEDPVRFERSIRVSIETGHNNALANDYSSTAYWYQAGPVTPLPPLPPVEARLPRPDPPELTR